MCAMSIDMFMCDGLMNTNTINFDEPQKNCEKKPAQ